MRMRACPPLLNYLLSCGGAPTARNLQRGGCQRLQRARSLFMLRIHISNGLQWFMSHPTILW